MVVLGHLRVPVPAGAVLPGALVAVRGEVGRPAHRPAVRHPQVPDPAVEGAPALARGVRELRVDLAVHPAVREEQCLDLDHDRTRTVRAGAARPVHEALGARVGGRELGEPPGERVPQQVRGSGLAGGGAPEVPDELLVRHQVRGFGGGGVLVPGDVGDGFGRAARGGGVVADVEALRAGHPEVGHDLSRAGSEPLARMAQGSVLLPPGPTGRPARTTRPHRRRTGWDRSTPGVAGSARRRAYGGRRTTEARSA